MGRGDGQARGERVVVAGFHLFLFRLCVLLTFSDFPTSGFVVVSDLVGLHLLCVEVLAEERRNGVGDNPRRAEDTSLL